MALSLTVMVAVREPVAVGVKVTEIVHWDIAGRLPPHVFVCAKSPGSSPMKVMLPIVNAVERLLVRVTILAGLVVPTVSAASVMEVGDTFACTMPVPDNDAVCGLLGASSVTVSVPNSAPMMLGVNVTDMVHCPLPGTLLPQVLVWAKSPLVAMLEMPSAES